MITRVGHCIQEAASHLSSYSLAACLQQWTTLLCNVVVLRWIAPTEMGIWATYLLWESILLILRLGMVNAMAREYPYRLGNKDMAGAHRVVQAAAFHTLLAGICLLIFLLGLTFFLRQRGAYWIVAGLWFCLYSPATLYQSFLEATFRGGREFALLARINAAAAALTIGSLVLVVFSGFPGFCMRQAGLAVVMAGLLHWLRPVKASPHWDQETIIDLFKTGLPLFASNFLTRMVNTIGQFTALLVGGQLLLGLYAPVSATATCFASLPNLFSTYFLPGQNYDYGQTGNVSRIIRNALFTGMGLTMMVLPFSLIAMAIIPWIIGEFLPAYQPSSTAMQMATLTGGLRCFGIATTCYSTLKAWRPLFLNLGLMAATQGGGVMVCAFCLPQHPLEAITLGILLGQIVYIPSTIHRIKTLDRSSTSH